jgi:hypothetical protein
MSATIDDLDRRYGPGPLGVQISLDVQRSGKRHKPSWLIHLRSVSRDNRRAFPARRRVYGQSTTPCW